MLLPDLNYTFNLKVAFNVGKIKNITHSYLLLYLRRYIIRIIYEEIKHLRVNYFSIIHKALSIHVILVLKF